MLTFLGMDVDPDDGHFLKDSSWLIKETRRRCFWFAYSLDGTIATSFGCPHMLKRFSAGTYSGHGSVIVGGSAFEPTGTKAGAAGGFVKGACSDGLWYNDVSDPESLGGLYHSLDVYRLDNPLNNAIPVIDIFNDLVAFGTQIDSRMLSHGGNGDGSGDEDGAESIVKSDLEGGLGTAKTTEIIDGTSQIEAVPQNPRQSYVKSFLMGYENLAYDDLDARLARWVTSVPNSVVARPSDNYLKFLLFRTDGISGWPYLQLYFTYHGCLCMLNQERLANYLRVVADRKDSSYSDELSKGRSAYEMARESALRVSELNERIWTLKPDASKWTAFLLFPAYYASVILCILQSAAGQSVILSDLVQKQKEKGWSDQAVFKQLSSLMSEYRRAIEYNMRTLKYLARYFAPAQMCLQQLEVLALQSSSASIGPMKPPRLPTSISGFESLYKIVSGQGHLSQISSVMFQQQPVDN
jgi:hypothetical protein